MKKEQTPNSPLSDGQAAVAAPPAAQASPQASPSSSPAHVPPPQDPRRRMRELLAIPDSQRSDALWDELIELEIQLAPGNRISVDAAVDGGGRGAGKPKRPEGRPPHEAVNKGPNPNKPAKPRFNKKPKPPRPQDAGPKES